MNSLDQSHNRQRILFNLEDYSSNQCDYFTPSQIGQSVLKINCKLSQKKQQQYQDQVLLESQKIKEQFIILILRRSTKVKELTIQSSKLVQANIEKQGVLMIQCIIEYIQMNSSLEWLSLQLKKIYDEGKNQSVFPKFNLIVRLLGLNIKIKELWIVRFKKLLSKKQNLIECGKFKPNRLAGLKETIDKMNQCIDEDNFQKSFKIYWGSYKQKTKYQECWDNLIEFRKQFIQIMEQNKNNQLKLPQKKKKHSNRKVHHQTNTPSKDYKKSIINESKQVNISHTVEYFLNFDSHANSNNLIFESQASNHWQ